MENIKRYFVIDLLILLVFSGLFNFVTAQERISITAEKLEVEKAWEALIKTKGGREKLHSVTNMLTKFSDVTRLDIFPDKYWDFSYTLVTYAPTVCLWDGGRLAKQCADANGITSADDKPFKNWTTYNRLPFILETRWDKPELRRVTQIRKGNKRLDVIEAIVEGERVDFIYEPEEMLVLEVRFYHGSLGWWMGYSLSNYTEINGIKMPQMWGLKEGKNLENKSFHTMPIQFSFNVDYDPELFTRPLKATTPDAWKPKPKA